jgi:hypothetical protein
MGISKKTTTLATVVAAAVVVGLTALPADAATTTRWADFTDLAGAAGAQTGALSLGLGAFPDATIATDAGTRNAGVVSGATTWLSPTTPVGSKYGTSRNQEYLNLPATTSNGPSTTTYTFDTATPTAGWAIVLGDIDADAVRVSATTATGAAVPTAQLNYRGGFNYCSNSGAGEPSCTGAATDVPTWDAATATLTGNDGASDTSGAAGWFEPTAAIKSLTFTFTSRSGLPIFQTWFTGLARDISGSVASTTDGGSAYAGATLTLTDANGDAVATTTSDASGAYAFPGYTAAPGYTVAVEVPAGWTANGPMNRGVDLTTQDAANVNFELAPPVVAPSGTIAGSVLDEDGVPVPDVTIDLDGALADVTTTTDADGTYDFAGLDVGDYTVTATAPDDFEFVGPAAQTVSIDDPGAAVTVPAFRLAAVVAEPTPTPTPTPTPDPTATAAPTSVPSPSDAPTGAPNPGNVGGRPGSGSLPATGAETLPGLTITAGLLLGLGALFALGSGSAAARRRRVHARTER